jgi:hypothetical protein
MLTIKSGGQTGVDIGAFEAAIRLGFDYGGWAPKGFRNENGRIPEVYARRMRESTDEGYALRTRLNVQDSDATLILSWSSSPEKAGGGTWFTEKACRQQGKQCVHLRLSRAGEEHPPDVQDGILKWLRLWNVHVLNVAGPRESKCPGIQAATIACLRWVLEPLAVEAVREATSVLDVIAQVARDLPSRPLRPPMTTDDAFRQVAATGSDDVRDQAIAELARRTHALGGHPAHIAINPANMDAAIAAGLDVQFVPDPVDSDAPARTYAAVDRSAATALFANPDPRFALVRPPADPPEGLDELQRAQLDASIREAERDIRGTEPPAPGDQTT